MNYIDIKKESLKQDIKFYRYMMKYNIIAILIFIIGISLISWLIYVDMDSTTLHILLGTQVASIIFMLSIYQQAKIDYRNALDHLTLLEVNEDHETAKDIVFKNRIRELEKIIINLQENKNEQGK